MSIRLLQKLFSSFYQYQEGKYIKKILNDCEKQKNMLSLFFNNLRLFMLMFQDQTNGCEEKFEYRSKFYTPKEEIQIRLHFLSFIFVYAGSNENIAFSQDHIDILWEIFTSSSSPEITDEFFDWLL
ncbi:Ubiquitin carboxyl-terminal hydrolase 34, partial [Sarcoptes scabiei]